MLKFFRLVVVLLCFAFSPPLWALDVLVKGLFKDGAILQIDGKQRMLRAGETSPEGVFLVAADTRQATLEIDGKRQTLGISRRISTEFAVPEKSVVRIQSGPGGHYLTPGRINGQPVKFMVDTGATAVSMNLPTARRLGLDYRNGRRVTISTASGVETAYQVTLRSVRVGGIEINSVEGIVSMGDFPSEILLGNSYLSRVDLRRESGVLVLEARF